jgi:hypothetical protein
MQFFRGLGEAESFGHGDEVAQVPKFHESRLQSQTAALRQGAIPFRHHVPAEKILAGSLPRAYFAGRTPQT